MAVTTQEQIDIGRVCGVLAANELQGGKIHGGALGNRNPILLHMVTDTLEDLYTLDPTNADIEPIQNYLNSICNETPRAAYLLDISAGGGSISPVIPGGDSTVQSIDWIVSATTSGSSPFATNATTVTFDGTGGMPDLRGYNMDYYRQGIIQYTNPQSGGGTYYSWNKISGVMQLFGDPPVNGAAQLDEPMRITPSR